jgi:hypothetical protein
VALETLAREYAPGLSRRKQSLLRRLERAELPSADAVLRLHEVATFLLAYPDDVSVHRVALRLLRGFERRRDLRRFAARLASTGLAGTAIEFRFFSRMARWLASRWPRRLSIDWSEWDDEALLEALLPFLAHPAESPGLDEYDLGLRSWLDRLKGPNETDATFLVRSVAALPAAESLRDLWLDVLDTPMTLAWGPGGPTRTAVRAPAPPHTSRPRASRLVHVQNHPLSRERPDLAVESHRPPVAVRAVTPLEGERYVDLAREAMVTRKRDLDAFSNADPRDVRLIEFEEGLTFACLGVLPKDRLLLESVYGFMTLKNGVPIGYVLTSALYGSCEIAYNVFDTFRGAEAGHVYARVVAMSRRLFGADAFTIYPYQLGEGNEEAIDSGAWWFYYKLGFRPLDRGIRRRVAKELARMRRNPEHRSTPATLRRLARGNVYFYLGAERENVIGRLNLANVGLAVSDFLARRRGAARAAATAELTLEARRALGLRSLAGWSAAEREALDRWAPLVLILPGLSRWSSGERRALADVVRAKGGRRESAFVQCFDAHARLRSALVELAKRNAPP